MAERIAIENLVPGMVILQVTEQNGPVKIRKSGLVTSPAMVQGLAEMGVQEVEIDPEQTVEIAPEPQKRTQTQALLRGQYDKGANFDHALSDQFNRSLFLPTVQGLPSMWKVYGKQAVLVAVLTIGGFGLGYTGATVSSWGPALFADKPQVVVVNQPAVAASESAVNETPQIASPSAGQDSKQTQTAEPTVPEIQSTAAQPSVAQVSNQQPAVATTDVEPRIVSQPAQSRPPQTEEQVSQPVYMEPTEANTPVELPNQVSPELLARFNKAIEELENREPEDFEPRERVKVHNDIQRVDQLPVRLLTRLPNMSFSTHMYASNKADRWVRVNGQEHVEGDWIDGEVQLVAIEPQRVVLSFEGEMFTMSALTDW